MSCLSSKFGKTKKTTLLMGISFWDFLETQNFLFAFLAFRFEHEIMFYSLNDSMEKPFWGRSDVNRSRLLFNVAFQQFNKLYNLREDICSIYYRKNFYLHYILCIVISFLLIWFFYLRLHYITLYYYYNNL